MECTQTIIHTVQPGETLNLIAASYQTTVSDITAKNPGLDPEHIFVGSQIIICPESVIETGLQNRIDLSNRIRLSWEQYSYWTRMLLISVVNRLPDQDAVNQRVMQIPQDFSEIYSAFYPEEAVKRMADVITEHLEVGLEMIIALRDNETEKANQLNQKFYTLVNEFAEILASLNPYYNSVDLKNMFYLNLNSSTQQTINRLSGKYEEDIQNFNNFEKEALDIADYLTNGIIAQFPQYFI